MLGTKTGTQSVLVPSAVLALTSLTLSFREHTRSAGKAGITCGLADRKSHLRHGFRVPVSIPL